MQLDVIKLFTMGEKFMTWQMTSYSLVSAYNVYFAAPCMSQEEFTSNTSENTGADEYFDDMKISL